MIHEGYYDASALIHDRKRYSADHETKSRGIELTDFCIDVSQDVCKSEHRVPKQGGAMGSNSGHKMDSVLEEAVYEIGDPVSWRGLASNADTIYRRPNGGLPFLGAFSKLVH